MSALIKNKNILKQEDLSFEILESGWYMLSIRARVKSEKQRGDSETDDEDLVVKLDSQEFPTFSDKNRLKNSPAAFSGGVQHNCDKIVVFLKRFVKGSHIFSMFPQHGAYVDSIELEKVAIDSNKLELNLDIQADDRDRKPWITFVVSDGLPKELFISAIVKWRFLDGDDIKIIVNGNTIENNKSLLHKNWIFSAIPIADFVGGVKEKSLKLAVKSLEQPSYIEFYADRKPTIKKLIFYFEDPGVKTHLQNYTDSVYESRNYNRYDNLIIEAVDYWNDFFSQQEYPPTELLDPNLVKAIIYRESKMGYVSDNNGEMDVMQVWDDRNPAKDAILGEFANEYRNTENAIHMSYSFPSNMLPPNVLSPKESIFWGVRWLYHKAQRYSGQGENGLLPPYFRNWMSWREAIYLYNSSDLVEDYISEVFSIYEKGIDGEGKHLWKD